MILFFPRPNFLDPMHKSNDGADYFVELSSLDLRGALSNLSPRVIGLLRVTEEAREHNRIRNGRD